MMRYTFWTVLLLALLGTCTSPPSLYAQQDVRKGTHLFRQTLHQFKLRPLKSLDELAGSEESKLLIVFGETDVLDNLDKFDLRGWIIRGGAALIATDREARGPAFKSLGVRIRPERVHLEVDSDRAYKGSESCQLVEPLREGRELFGQLKRVATNHAGFISDNNRDLRDFARFPSGSFVPGVARGYIRFAVGGNLKKGRVLILSDHSVFINTMMFQDDNDNVDFAYNCIDWLTNSGKRTQVLFFDERKVQTEFKLPFNPPPPPKLPPPEELIGSLNKGLAGVEEENGFNRALNELPGGGSLPLQTLGIILTIALVGFALSRLVQARQRFEPGVPHLSSGLTMLVPSVEVLDQRHRALLRHGNFWELARLQARQSWEAVLGSAPGSGLGAAVAQRHPPIQVRASGRRGRKLRRLAQRLWSVAYGVKPTWISARRWRRTENDISMLRAAFADGSLGPAILDNQTSQRSDGLSPKPRGNPS